MADCDSLQRWLAGSTSKAGRHFESMNTTTKIAGKDIPIDEGALSVVNFSLSNSGDIEVWEFWTLYDGSRSVTGRCRQGVDPGERFRRMEGQPDYEDAWEIAAAAKGLRPSTEKSVIDWLNSHEEDAQLAGSCQIGSKNFRVVRTDEGFRLE
jgi:hypothetical protein